MKTLKMVRQILAPKYKIAAVFLIISMFFGALLEIVSLAMLMPLVSAFADPGLFERNKYLKMIYDFIAPADMRQFIIFAACILIVIYLLKNIYNFAVFYAQSYFTMKLTLNITDRIYRNSIYRPYKYFLTADNAEVTNKIVRISEFGVNFLMPFFICFTEAMVFAVIMLAILIIIPEVALTSFVLCFAVTAGFYIFTRKKIEAYGKQEHIARNSMMILLTNTLAAVKDIKLSKSEDFFRKAMNKSQAENMLAVKRITDWGNLPRMLLETLSVMLAMSILIFLLWRDTNFSRIIFLAAFFLGAMFRLLPSISRLQHNLHWVKHYSYLFTLIHSSLVNDTSSVPKTDKVPDFSFKNELVFEKVSFSYPNSAGKKVIRDLDLQIKSNECVVFTGVSGCGKTTVIDLISGLLEPDSGTIKADNIKLNDILNSWQNQIGYVQQETILLNTTLRENIALGVPPEKIDNERIAEVLKLAQIEDFVNTLPDKCNTSVGGANIRLSGGQKQRIAIARALYKNPKILILDEATSALDAETENAFAQSIKLLKGKLTIIMIAHREKMVEICDREIHLG